MSNHPPFSPLADPFSLGKVQILLIPVHLPSSSSSQAPQLSDNVYRYWSNLIKANTSMRSDEIRTTTTSSSSSPNHTRGASTSSQPRSRFLPNSTSTSISKSNTTQHVHLSYPTHPPSSHLYPLSLLKLSTFPLIVIGIAVNPDETSSDIQGYTINEEDEDEISGDVGQPSTPKTSGLNEPLSRFQDSVSELFPRTSAFPLVKRLILVPRQIPETTHSGNVSPRKGGRGEDGQGNVKGKGKKDEVRVAPFEGGEAWVGRLLGEVIGDLWGELGELVTALETPTGLKTLSSTLLPSLTSTNHGDTLSELFGSRTATPKDIVSKRASTTTPTLTQHTSTDSLSGAMGISLTRALTPGGRPTSVAPVPIAAPQASPIETKPSSSSNPFRRSTAISSPFSRTSSASTSMTPSPSGGLQSPIIAAKYTGANLSGIAGGRLMKILGDVYLLIGSYGDAIKCYDDGAERSRVMGDVLWEAVAREGRAVAGIGEAWDGRDGSDRSQSFSSSPIPIEILAHFLSSLSCLARSPLPYPPSIISPAPQSLAGSISLPTSGPSTTTPNIGTGEGLLSYLYTSLCLRIAHFHLIIWSSSGWGSIALNCLINHSFPRSFPTPLTHPTIQDPHARRRRHKFLNNLSTKSGISRNTVIQYAESSVGPYMRSMSEVERLNLMVDVSWISRWLDLGRHEVVYSREVVKRLGRLIVDGRNESRRRDKMINGSGSCTEIGGGNGGREAEGHQGGMIGLGIGSGNSGVGKNEVAIRRRESVEGNLGLLNLMERITFLMGIDLILSSSNSQSPNNISSRLEELGEDNDDKRQNNPRFGWPELQVDTLQSLVSVAEGISDQEMIIRLCLSGLKNLNGYLNATSQGHLIRLVITNMGILKRRGKWKGVGEWWIPGKLVLSLEVASLSINRFPTEHSTSEIIVKGKKDPFLYNPRLKSVEIGKSTIVAKEQVDIFVTLSNPFAFELEISDLSLLTTGVEFIANPLPLLLPANSVQTVRLTGISSTPGKLYIQGVKLQLPDGSSDTVYLPVIDEKAKIKRDKRKSRELGEMGKMKKVGLDARFTEVKESKRESEVPNGSDKEVNGDSDVTIARTASKGALEDGERWLECNVVPEMPLLWIKKTNLTHGTAMLYDGESTNLRLILENSSSTPVNFLKLSFNDNTIIESQAILNEELNPKEAYEVENEMINRPVMSWDGKSEVDIPSNAKYTVNVKILGKVGCTDGAIRIDYGFVDPQTDSSTSSGKFHTRQINFPILFTVYHTLDIYDLQVLRFSSDITETTKQQLLPNGDTNHHDQDDSTATDHLGKALKEESDRGHCLITFNLRNVYGIPFEVNLTRSSEAKGHPDKELKLSKLIPPGATERLIMPFPRLHLDSSLILPIPTLSNRQYVIDKSGKSQAQIQAERELFWYKEELLKSLWCTWIDPASKRDGIVNLRRLSLGDDEILKNLKTEEVKIDVRLVCDKSGDKFRSGDFGSVVVTVSNSSDENITPHVRIDTTSSVSVAEQSQTSRQRPYIQSSSKYIIFDGIQAQTLPRLSPGEQAQFTVGVVFLAEGDFKLRAVVEEVLDTTALQREPRVWFSEALQVTI